MLHHLGGADVPLVRDARFDTEFATFGLTDDAESVGSTPQEYGAFIAKEQARWKEVIQKAGVKAD